MSDSDLYLIAARASASCPTSRKYFVSLRVPAPETLYGYRYERVRAAPGVYPPTRLFETREEAVAYAEAATKG